MFENSYSILDLLGWLFVGIAIGACILYFALWVYAVRRASGLTKRAPDVWDSAAFSSIFLASSFSCSQALSTPAHTQVTQTVGRLRVIQIP